jgi:hypothetical protein
MDIEFNIFKLKSESNTYKKWAEMPMLKSNIDSEFIVVGEEKVKNITYLKIIPIENNNICLIGGLMLDEAAFGVDEEDISYTSCTSEFDIPKKYLTLDIIDNIKKVNERLIS